MLRGIKVRLYPSKEQATMLNKLLGCCRFVYNQSLALKKDAYDKDKTSLGLTDLGYNLHQNLLKNPEYSWLNEQNTKVLKQSTRHVLKAYENFFKGNADFPRFKSKRDKQSATFPLEAISKRNTFEERTITLTKDFKNLKFKCSDLYLKRLQKHKDKIRNATVSKTKGGSYFLAILVDVPQEELVKFKHTAKHVGIDMGVKDFAITSDGVKYKNLHFFKTQEKKIKKLNKQLSKKQKGSKNREKQRIRLARAYERLTNKREAYVHSVVNGLLGEYDLIFIEDVNVKGMLKNHKLAKSIQEVGLGRCKEVLLDKANINGKQVVLVGRFYPSSKTCSNCGYVKHDLTLKDREWVCPACGVKHDRDLNAAVNVLREGIRTIGGRTAEFTLAENPTADDRSEMNLKSSGSMKQEEINQ